MKPLHALILFGFFLLTGFAHPLKGAPIIKIINGPTVRIPGIAAPTVIELSGFNTNNPVRWLRNGGVVGSGSTYSATRGGNYLAEVNFSTNPSNPFWRPMASFVIPELSHRVTVSGPATISPFRTTGLCVNSNASAYVLGYRWLLNGEDEKLATQPKCRPSVVVPGDYSVKVFYRYKTEVASVTTAVVMLAPAAQAPSVHVSKTTHDPVSEPPIFKVWNFSSFTSVTWLRNGKVEGQMQSDIFSVQRPGRYIARAIWSGKTVYSPEIVITKRSIPDPIISSENGGVITYEDPEIRLSINKNYKAGITWYFNNNVIEGADEFVVDIIRPGAYKVNACATHPDGKTECRTSSPRIITGEILRVNYVKEQKIKIEGIQTVQQLQNVPKESASTSTNYQDGFGRSIQTVRQASSPLGKDGVTFSAYDAFGRELNQYLPLTRKTETGKYSYMSASSLMALTNFYLQNNDAIANTAYPFSETVYEPSPLSRLVEKSAQGEDWKLNSGHTLKFLDMSNKATDNVRIWKVNSAGLTSNAVYESGMLSMKKSVDEHNQATFTFTDKDGNMILSDRPGSNNERLQTYFVYDDMGRLTHVIPPKVVKKLGTGTKLTLDQLTLAKESYQYKYDERSRLSQKQLPGTQPMLFVYDPWDRQVLSQDGNQRVKGKWSFTKYDALDRVVLTGEIHDARSQVLLIQAVRNFYASVLQNASRRHEIRATSIHGYSNRSFPVVKSELEVNTVNFYDDYAFASSQYKFVPEPAVGLNSSFNRVQGLLTGIKNRVLGTGKYLNAVKYYDSRYRLVQTVADNHLGAIDRVSSQYDFSGKIIKEKSFHKGLEEINIVGEYIYDHGDRLQKVYHQVNNDPKILIADHRYNELGQLIEKDLHVDDSGKPWQSMDFNYHIRGWLSSMNDTTVDPDARYSDLYAFQLLYNEAGKDFANTPRYNGNISSFKEERPYELEASGQIVKSGYAYAYDPANQLKSSNFFQVSDPSRNGTRNETYAYDLNGNITSLNRNGIVEGKAQTVDALVYHYDANQLTGVKDNGNAKEGFKDQGTISDYSYDPNGNMITDDNKKISSIHYNILNLTDTILFKDGRAIVYVYDISGKKLQQKVFAANGVVKLKRDYVGGVVYENDTLQEILHREGRIVRQVPGVASSPWEYQYHLKDHLGNVKSTFTTQLRREVYLATFEDKQAASESKQFNVTYDKALRYNAPIFNHTQSGMKSQRLSGANKNEIIGLAKSLQVMPGDTIKMEVFAKYFSPTAKPSNIQNLIVAAMSGSLEISTGMIGEAATQSMSALNSAGLLIHTGDEIDDRAPKTYLNYILFDQDFMPYDLGFEQVSTAALENGKNTAHEKLSMQATIKRPGYIYVYLSNENSMITDVFFDDLEITHVHSPLIATTDYYPFGMIARQYNREGTVDQRFKYNSKEFHSEEGIDWYDYGARMYDAQIGRWNVVDPMAEKFYSHSPYNYVLNNPIILIDPDGSEPDWFQAAAGINLTVGTGGVSAGLSATVDLKAGNESEAGAITASYGLGVTYHSNLLKTGKSGIEFRNSFMGTYDNRSVSTSLGTNFWDGVGGLKEFAQRTGIMTLNVGEFTSSFENDGTIFDLLKAGDGGDSYRTAAFSAGYGDFSLNMNLFTGRRDEESGRIERASPGGARGLPMGLGQFGEQYNNGPVVERGPRYRYGGLTLNVGGLSLGADSEWIRHLGQNIIAHDFFTHQRQFPMLNNDINGVMNISNAGFSKFTTFGK